MIHESNHYADCSSAGDFIDLFMAWMVLNTAMKVSSCKDRDKLRAIMVSNIAIDFVIGLVPFLGDIADTFFRCNTKNAVAFEKMLNDRVKASEKRGGAHTDNGPYHETDVEQGLPPSYEAVHRDRHETIPANPAVPKPTKTKSTARGGGGGGWFGGRREAGTDLERGEGDAPPMPPRR